MVPVFQALSLFMGMQGFCNLLVFLIFIAYFVYNIFLDLCKQNWILLMLHAVAYHYDKPSFHMVSEIQPVCCYDSHGSFLLQSPQRIFFLVLWMRTWIGCIRFLTSSQVFWTAGKMVDLRSHSHNYMVQGSIKYMLVSNISSQNNAAASVSELFNAKAVILQDYCMDNCQILEKNLFL